MAKELLELKTIGIDEVSFAVGYEDTNSFRKLFKRNTGLTPTAYRKKFSGISGEINIPVADHSVKTHIPGVSGDAGGFLTFVSQTYQLRFVIAGSGFIAKSTVVESLTHSQSIATLIKTNQRHKHKVN